MSEVNEEGNTEETPKGKFRPFNGAEDGNGFDKLGQPDPELKKLGWQKKRAEKLLTQKILEVMLKGKTLDDYVGSLVDNAIKGNPKAIDTINNGIEEQVVKQEIKTSETKIILPPQPNDE